MPRTDDPLIDYYRRELRYLRVMGAEFAARYPKIAARLELGSQQSDDPHVEQLIQSFAFLTGRLQQALEADFPEFTGALLDLLYPQLRAPVPPLSIACLEPDPLQGDLSSGYRVPRGTPLIARTDTDVACRFRTCQEVWLWPVVVSDAALLPPDAFADLDLTRYAAALRITFQSRGRPFEALGCRRLRVFIDCDPVLAAQLYDLIGARLAAVLFRDGPRRRLVEAEAAVVPAGFAADEALLPYPPNAPPAFRLLQEYFALPEKFLFFDVVFEELRPTGQSFDALLLLDSLPQRQLTLSSASFRLGCTPIANLFPKTAEPIRVHQRQLEYRVVPDLRRELSTELHTIEQVVAVSEAGESRPLAPLFSFEHRPDGSEARAFWHARRRPTGRVDLPGTDLRLSFLDLDLRPADPGTDTVMVRGLATNRTFAEMLPAGARLSLEQPAPISTIRCLRKPTAARYAVSEGATAWQVISHLAPNYLSLADSPNSLPALREVLRLHADPDDAAQQQQIAALRGLDVERVVRRIGGDAWRGFCRGLEVTLTIDEATMVGASPLLLGAVLSRYFALQASVNSFAQLRLRSTQRPGILKTWPPIAGDRPLQ